MMVMGVGGLMAMAAVAAVPTDEQMKGPFLIASTPYYEDGAVDYEALVKEAQFMDASGCCGVMWPQSNDSIDLLTHEEKFTAITKLVEAAKDFKNAVLTIGVNGTNTAEMLEFVAFAEKLAAKSPAPIAFSARPPTYGKTEKDVHDYYEALGKVAKRPVIIQTYVSAECPAPTVEFLVDLAKRYPGVFGYVKEESEGKKANARQAAETAQKPPMKTVFSAWGGWQWKYQNRKCGTEGLITERAAYSPLAARVWQHMKNGDKEGKLLETYAMFRFMIDQRFTGMDSLRGYSLYYLKRLGLFKTTKSRTYLKAETKNSGTFGKGSQWKLVDISLTDVQKAELDANYDGMMRFLERTK